MKPKDRKAYDARNEAIYKEIMLGIRSYRIIGKMYGVSKSRVEQIKKYMGRKQEKATCISCF